MKTIYYINIFLFCLILSFQNCGKVGESNDVLKSEHSSYEQDNSNNSSNNSDESVINLPPLEDDNDDNFKVIFHENFEDQPEWTSDVYALSKTLPEKWTLHRQDTLWSPRTGHYDRHAVAEIVDTSKVNTNMARGKKAYVSWRESHNPGWKKWNSDSLLVKHFPEGYNEIYVELYINFSNEMVKKTFFTEGGPGASKGVRIYHFDGNLSEPFRFFGGYNNPNFIWGYSGSKQYGIRNKVSFYTRRDGNSEGRHLGSNGDGNGDESLSYWSNLDGMGKNGEDVRLPDKKNGGLITSGAVEPEQVFGDESNWTKVAFYVKMNSAPGKFDGALKQWVDDIQIQNRQTVNWVESDRNMVKWTAVAISGNDYFSSYPNDQRYEEWYSIDDITITNKIPKHLRSPKD